MAEGGLSVPLPPLHRVHPVDQTGLMSKKSCSILREGTRRWKEEVLGQYVYGPALLIRR